MRFDTGTGFFSKYFIFSLSVLLPHCSSICYPRQTYKDDDDDDDDDNNNNESTTSGNYRQKSEWALRTYFEKC